MRENAPRLYALKENARRIVFCRKQFPIREAAVRKNPNDTLSKRKLAEFHAELGDWPKALEVFAKAGGEFKKMAEGETSGTCAEQRVKEVEEVAVDMPRAVSSVVSVAPQKQGLYCVIDLSGGLKAKRFPVSYLDDVPSGGWTDEYKKDKLVLRRIDPKGPKVGECRVFFGGSWEASDGCHTSYDFHHCPSDSRNKGFRLCLTLRTRNHPRRLLPLLHPPALVR